MEAEKVIKVVEEEIEKEVENIINSAKEEKEKILNEAKKKIEEEIEQKRKLYQDEMSKKLSLEKLFIESELNKTINKTVSEAFSEIYSEVVKEVKNKILSFKDSKELILSIIEKSIQSLQKDKSIVIVLSQSNFEKHGEEIKKELQKKYSPLEVKQGEIDGGVIIKQDNITIDVSIDRIIKMFEPFIYNTIYKKLPKTTL